METFTLTTPISPADISGYQAGRLSMDWPLKRIEGYVRDNVGKIIPFSYSGTTAETLMRAFNTMDFSVTSMHKRLLERLSADGFLGPGTVTGVPD